MINPKRMEWEATKGAIRSIRSNAQWCLHAGFDGAEEPTVQAPWAFPSILSPIRFDRMHHVVQQQTTPELQQHGPGSAADQRLLGKGFGHLLKDPQNA
jgi:hypothetical protein